MRQKPGTKRSLGEKVAKYIWLFTAQRWSTEQTINYTTPLIGAVDQLVRGDRRGRPVSIAEGMLKSVSGRHVIYFRRTENSFVVVRVLHQSMDVERHIKDLPATNQTPTFCVEPEWRQCGLRPQHGDQPLDVGNGPPVKATLRS